MVKSHEAHTLIGSLGQVLPVKIRMIICNGLKILAFSAFVSICVGCTRDPYLRLDGSEHQAKLSEDAQIIEKIQDQDVPQVLSVSQAVKRALDKNLDASVAALEAVLASNDVTLQKLNLLPSIRAKGTFSSRADEAASSSRSILTGTQSLEPSTSSDRNRRIANLEVQWNNLDAVISLLDKYVANNNELIALERLRKVKHNIERDVTAAFWKAYAYQQAQDEAIAVEKNLDRILNNIETASAEKLTSIDDSNDKIEGLTSVAQTLSQLKEEVSLSEIELKSLISLPLTGQLILQANENTLDKTHSNILKQDINALIQEALLQRPEMRENILTANIERENYRKEIMRSFPALELFAGYNYDTNSFLSDQDWNDFNVSLTQSIISILTLPKRADIAKDRRALADTQRLALTAAIIAQVHVAKMRVGIAEENYNRALSLYNAAKTKAHSDSSKYFEGSVSGYDKTVSKADYITRKLQKDLGFADFQEAYTELIASVGHAVYSLENTVTDKAAHHE